MVKQVKLPTLQERYNNVVRDLVDLRQNFDLLSKQHHLSNSRVAWLERDEAKAAEELVTAEETMKHYQALYEAACQRADTLARRCDYYQTLAPKSDVPAILDTSPQDETALFLFKALPRDTGGATNYVVVSAYDYSEALNRLNCNLPHDFEFHPTAVATEFGGVALLTDVSNI